jgi:putative sugar O-methyltransferase
MGDIMSALQVDDILRVRDSFDNFYRRSCSAGLVGLPTNMDRFFKNNESSLDRRWFLNDSIYRINYLKSKLGDFDLENLASNTFGNPYGIYLENKFIRNGADYQYFYALKLEELCNKSDFKMKKVVEIGGGYGGVASYLLQNSKISQYINYDLPENLALATYTLMTIFPEEDFLLYGEEGSEDIKSCSKRIVMLPAHEIKNLSTRDLSVGFNSFSFSEMSFRTAKNYIDLLSNLKIPYIFHVNHVKNSRTSADNLIPSGYHLQERIPANWNLGRSSTCDEFEFLFSIAE